MATSQKLGMAPLMERVLFRRELLGPKFPCPKSWRHDLAGMSVQTSPTSGSKMRALAWLLRYAESLSHRSTYGRQRALLRWTVGNHAVVLNSDR